MDIESLFKGLVLERLKENLERFFGFPVEVNIKNFKSEKLSEVVHIFGDPEEHNAVILMRVTGSIPGYLVAVFPVRAANSLVKHLLGQTAEAAGEWTDMERSAIKETSNLIAGSVLTVLSDALGKSLVASIPGMTLDMVLAAVDVALIDIAKATDTASILEMEFIDHEIRGYIFYLMDEGSYRKLARSIEEKNA